MTISLDSFMATGTNSPASQVSVTKWNLLLETVAAGVNSAGGAIDPDTLPYVTVEDYGAVADFVTDDKAAFELAEAEAVASGRFVWLRSPRYYVSSFNAHKPVFWLGSGGNAVLSGAGGTIIRAAKNANGWVWNKGNTHGDGLGAQGDSSGGKMQGVCFYGGNVNVDGSGNITSYSAGDSATGHGVRIRATLVELEDVMCAFYGGDGFNINCTSGGGDSVTGNANNFRLIRCQAIYNSGFALLTNGLDANAGQIDTFSAISCAAGGITEYSFLGNTYTACHVRDCGVSDPLGNDSATGTCVYLGVHYYVVAGQHVAASTTTPGTNSAVWATFVGHPSSKTWVTGLDWSPTGGAPYATNPANVNGRNVFTGCYAESAQPPVQATHPSLFVGGLLDEVGVVGTASWLRAGPSGLYNKAGYAVDGANATIQTGGDGGNELTYYQRGSDNFRVGYDATHGFRTQHQNSLITERKGLASDVSTLGPFHHYIYRLHVGGTDANPNNATLIQCAAAAPTTGAWRRGTIVFDTAPSAGGKIGWVCTVAGTPGTWKAWGAIDA